MKVIAIDGPAGAGKSTIARKLAIRCGLDYLDTGAMYRAITFALLHEGIDLENFESVASVTLGTRIEIDGTTVVVNGVDATAAIRSPEVTSKVSVVAANSMVREVMRQQQREWVHRHAGGVMEGRDIGTVVFPDAILKVFLTASPSVRAERRVNELGGDVREVEIAILERDRLDSARDDSPLRHDDDYLIVDTSEMDIESVVDYLYREYVARLGAGS